MLLLLLLLHAPYAQPAVVAFGTVEHAQVEDKAGLTYHACQTFVLAFL
jgi:hypothetical protein